MLALSGLQVVNSERISAVSTSSTDGSSISVISKTQEVEEEVVSATNDNNAAKTIINSTKISPTILYIEIDS